MHFFESVVPSCCQVSFHMSGTEAVMCVPTSEQKDRKTLAESKSQLSRRLEGFLQVRCGYMMVYVGCREQN